MQLQGKRQSKRDAKNSAKDQGKRELIQNNLARKFGIVVPSPHTWKTFQLESLEEMAYQIETRLQGRVQREILAAEEDAHELQQKVLSRSLENQELRQEIDVLRKMDALHLEQLHQARLDALKWRLAAQQKGHPIEGQLVTKTVPELRQPRFPAEELSIEDQAKVCDRLRELSAATQLPMVELLEECKTIAADAPHLRTFRVLQVLEQAHGYARFDGQLMKQTTINELIGEA